MKHYDANELSPSLTPEKELKKAAEFIRAKVSQHQRSKFTISSFSRSIAITLGSGLGDFATNIENPIAIDASDIPNFPTPSVAGHQGQLVFGLIQNKPVILIKGRVHLYEGRSVEEVVFYVRLINELGVGSLILTNAAGGIHPDFMAGELCLITDIINLMFKTVPHIHGETKKSDPIFCSELANQAKSSALAHGIHLREGIYAGVLGPSYETKAEVRMLRTLGADLVGMSTILESQHAKQLGIKVIAISLITNKAAGLSGEALSHHDVQAVAQGAKSQFSKLLKAIITSYSTP